MRKLIKRVIAIVVSLHSRDLRKHGGHGNKIFLGKATANDLFILQPCVPSKGFLQNKNTQSYQRLQIKHAE